MLSDKVPYFILDLLQQAPSVYVEGLGRFEAIFHPAVIDIPNARIKPPYVEPGFNADQEAPTDLLASFILYSLGTSAGSPKEAIEQFVRKVYERTTEGNTYTIEEFGTFSRNANGLIRFTPDWDAFNLSFSGLEVLDIGTAVESNKPYEPYTPPAVVHTPVHEVVEPVIVYPSETTLPAEEPIPPVDTIAPVETTIQAPSNGYQDSIDETTSRLWWIILTAALVLIAVMCAYLAWDIISTRQKINDLKEIYPDTTRTAPDVVVTTPVDTTTGDTGNAPAPIEYKNEIPTTPKDTEDVSGTPCYVVVGAFTDPANINKMVDRLTSLGYTSEQIKGGSLTRVAIRTSCDQDTLLRILNEARSTISPESWIY